MALYVEIKTRKARGFLSNLAMAPPPFTIHADWYQEQVENEEGRKKRISQHPYERVQLNAQIIQKEQDGRDGKDHQRHDPCESGERIFI